MQQRSLPPAASSVHRNASNSSDQSDSDDSSHRVSKGKVKEVKKGNESGDKIKKMALGKLFYTKPAGNNEGLGKGGKNGGKKAIGQVVVVTEESKFNNNDLNNCHVQNQHPKYASSPSTFNNSTSANNFTKIPSSISSIMVRIDLTRLDLTRLGIPMEKLKSAGLLKTPQVPVIEQQKPQVQQQSSQRSSSSMKKRRHSSVRDDEEQNWPSKKVKNVDRLSVSSSTSNSSSSSSSSSSDVVNAASSSRVSFPLDRLNNNSIDHKPPPPQQQQPSKESFYHSPSSVDTKLTKIKREQKLASPQKESKDVKSKVKQEKTSDSLDVEVSMRSRSCSMTNASLQPQQTYKDVKKKKFKASHEEILNGTSSNSFISSSSSSSALLIPPTNHDRLISNERLVNGDLLNNSAIVPTTTTIVKRVFVSYFERNNDNAEQAEMR